jgi:Asp-tRNA(Asn)/Glu-tRNA(Gln) amidotransferase A subunit family amidase
MPTGFNQRKLPTSISFIGKLYDEATLLQIGKLFQDITSWDDVHPALFQ